MFRPCLAQGAFKIGPDKLRSRFMHLPWNQYHVGPVKIVHGGNGGNSVEAITMATAVAAVAVNDGGG